MADKRVMIDGVDVSGCENYGETMAKTHNCTLYDEYLRPCKGTDCYYKNWQRKEQECARLNSALGYRRAGKKTFIDLSVELDQLKAENEKYALFIEKLCDYAGLECDSEEQAMRTLSDLASQMNKARWIIDRYKQTLAEMKPILELYADSRIGEAQPDGTYKLANDGFSYSFGFINSTVTYDPRPAKQGLQKIKDALK